MYILFKVEARRRKKMEAKEQMLKEMERWSRFPMAEANMKVGQLAFNFES